MFCGSCFICIERVEENHCLKDLLGNLQKTAKLFIVYGIAKQYSKAELSMLLMPAKECM